MSRHVLEAVLFRLLVGAGLVFALTTTLATGASGQKAPQGLPAQRSPVFGGAGGAAFSLSCGPGRLLTGVRARTADFVFALGMTCRAVLPDGSLGPESAVGDMVGGSSGAPVVASCSPGHVVVAAEVRAGTYLQGMVLQCGAWDGSRRRANFRTTHQLTIGQAASGRSQHQTHCENETQPMVGMWGRAQSLVDAVGFICDEP